jgi:hypothetical protein
MADCAVALDALCLRIAAPESLDVTKLAHAFVTLARPRRRVPVTASMALPSHGSHAHGLPARTRYPPHARPGGSVASMGLLAGLCQPVANPWAAGDAAWATRGNPRDLQKHR